MVAIVSFADSDFQDKQRPLDPQAARIVQLPLARVDAWAELTLSDLAEKGVDFSRAEIAGGTVKTVDSSGLVAGAAKRSEEHTSELQSLMRISYAVVCLKKNRSITMLHAI